MTSTFRVRQALFVTKLGVTALLAGAPGLSHACSSDPYIGTLCISALVSPQFSGGISNVYIRANGQKLDVARNAPLYSLIGNTYGGTANVNFNVPDTRGRVILGAAATDGVSNGQTGGASQITLNVGDLPQHNHPVVLNGVNVSLVGVTATANLSSGTFAGTSSGLTMNVTTNSGTEAPVAGAALGAPTGSTKSYSASLTPSGALAAGTISGTVSGNTAGTVPVTLNGTGSFSVNTPTGYTGSGQPFSIMPPYITLTYFIAVTGVYPSAP